MRRREKIPALPRGGENRLRIGGYFDWKSQREKRRTQGQRDVMENDIVAHGRGFDFDGHRESSTVRVSEEGLLIPALSA